MMIEQPNGHEKRRSRPIFRSIVKGYPPGIVLPVEDWEETWKPLLCLQDTLLNTLKSQSCGFSQVMRELLLHLTILQRNSHQSAAVQVLDSNLNETVTEQSPTLVTEAGQNTLENDLDRCLCALLSSLQKTNSVLVVDRLIIERMSSLLAFDSAETATRVRSVVEAQKLIDSIDLLIHNQTFLSHCGRNAACKAALLASEIYSKVPLLPRPVFLNGPTQRCDWLLQNDGLSNLEASLCSTFLSRILDHDYIIPYLWIYQGDELKFVYGNVNEEHEPVDKWLARSRPNFVARIRVMLAVAKAIRYIHSMDVVVALGSIPIDSHYIALDSNLHAKILCSGVFAWQVRDSEDLIFEGKGGCTPEHNIATFADLFEKVCFRDDNENLPNDLVEDVRRLIERCRVEDPKSRPSMENVVNEMEAWDLT
ncbi:hypothetical protein M378DRAFT_14939 [Amanita muscaria Koide BX008]|uniref:Protein kinase domain-containing protein n=1 Tax=Amanita muscaria (strain Koide BX008) TaxID=946122 RepID=A0A0C2WR61_AMAMK|nr:hypothetical protein M378DRAFT_14939 [Amanita muscaria Koide BX008]